MINEQNKWCLKNAYLFLSKTKKYKIFIYPNSNINSIYLTIEINKNFLYLIYLNTHYYNSKPIMRCAYSYIALEEFENKELFYLNCFWESIIKNTYD